ncbi:MAG: glycosyltransferase family 9 protein, partial [Planctomycetota bacterium]
ALHALRLAGAESLTVLGSPASWGFLRKAHGAPRVRDFSSSEWLGLFAAGVAFGPAARATLARTQTAIVALHGDTARTEKALREAGVQQALFVPPPLAEPFPPPLAGGGRGRGDVGLHAARRLLDPLAPLLGAGVAEAALAIEAVADDVFLELDEAERVRGLARLGYDDVPGAGFVAIHPGSGGRRKCWPAERYAKLAVKLAGQGALTPLLLFGPADEDTRREFEARIPPGADWECVAERPLREVLALLSCARCYVGNDSGITHLAARACPTVALFGPTDPRVWAPLGQRVKIVQAPGGVLDRLEVDEVAEEIQSGLRDQSSRAAALRG